MRVKYVSIKEENIIMQLNYSVNTVNCITLPCGGYRNYITTTSLKRAMFFLKKNPYTQIDVRGRDNRGNRFTYCKFYWNKGKIIKQTAHHGNFMIGACSYWDKSLNKVN